MFTFGQRAMIRRVFDMMTGAVEDLRSLRATVSALTTALDAVCDRVLEMETEVRREHRGM